MRIDEEITPGRLKPMGRVKHRSNQNLARQKKATLSSGLLKKNLKLN
jgi:hypothetical protein